MNITKENQWKNKTILYMFSQGLSLVGSSLVGYALSWYLNMKTNSATVLTIGIVANILPSIIVSPFAGIIADKFNRKKIIIVVDLFIALSTFSLFLMYHFGNESLIATFIIVGIRSLGGGIQSPTVNAYISDIVPKNHLPRINSIQSTINSILQLAPPILGMIILVNFGIKFTLLLDVITAVLASIVMLFVKEIDKNKDEEKNKYSNISGFNQKEIIKDFKAGVKYVYNNKILRLVFIISAVNLFFLSPVVYMTPLLIQRKFGMVSWMLTFNEIIWLLANVIGGIILTVNVNRISKRVNFILLGRIANSLFYMISVFVSSFWGYSFFMFLPGIIMPFIDTFRVSITQENTDNKMLGRVFSIYHMAVEGSLLIGILISGPLADTFDISTVIGVTCLISAIACILLSRTKLYKEFRNY